MDEAECSERERKVTTAPTIRAYEERDLDVLYDVCVRTAASGGDLSDSLGDVCLPGHLFAAPYCVRQPKLALVAENGDGVGGYVVGAADTAAFERVLEVEWWPELRRRYQPGSGTTAADDRLIALLHQPEHQDADIVAEYPAHLHINLLPRLQGRGLGRQLIDGFCAGVRRRGATGIHLGVNPANRRARDFYVHLGFIELRATRNAVILGRRLDRPS